MNVESNSQIKCTIALGALAHVYDPEIGLSVVDLGLIYRIDFDEENKAINCLMTLTTQHCPMGESIKENVEHALKESFNDYSIHVSLTFDPSWNYERISDEGKEYLKR